MGTLVIPGKILKEEVFAPTIGESRRSPGAGRTTKELKMIRKNQLKFFRLFGSSSTRILAPGPTPSVRQCPSRLTVSLTTSLVLVGGFANSGFLFDMVKTTFADRVSTFLRPPDCDVATVQGAARYGLELLRGKLSVMNCIAPKSYMMREF